MGEAVDEAMGCGQSRDMNRGPSRQAELSGAVASGKAGGWSFGQCCGLRRRARARRRGGEALGKAGGQGVGRCREPRLQARTGAEESRAKVSVKA